MAIVKYNSFFVKKNREHYCSLSLTLGRKPLLVYGSYISKASKENASDLKNMTFQFL
jgi:hypothetical protein